MRFRIKIILCVMLLLTFTFSVGGSLLISTSFRSSLDSRRDSALGAYRMILYTLEAVSELYTDNFTTTMWDTMEQLDQQSDRSWRALRLKSAEQTIYATVDGPAFTGSQPPDDPGLCSAQYFTGSSGARYLQISGLFGVGNAQYVLEALFDISTVYEARDSQLQIYSWVFGTVILIGLVVSWLMASWLTHPLRRLSRTARRISEGELDCRADLRTQDEVGELAKDFNAMAQRLQDKIQELEESIRRQEEFMGSFAHELKTPMTSVIGYADLLRGRDLEPEEQREAANYVFKEGKRLEALSIKLLDLLVLRRKDFDLSPASPKALLAEVARTLAPALYKAGIRLRCRGEDGLCLLEPDLIKSLLTNLIDNARKAMDNPGVIRVELSMLPDGCCYRVTDQGRGMRPEEIERVKEAFYRVDKSRSRAQGGAGLGLSLCQQIVDLHHGTMEFFSRPGQGTQVVVTLKGGLPEDVS